MKILKINIYVCYEVLKVKIFGNKKKLPNLVKVFYPVKSFF